MTEARRAAAVRGRQRKKQRDGYKELGKLAGLVGSVCAAVLGQAELVGEPYRHWLTITAIVAVAVWAYCMKPTSIRAVMDLVKRTR